MPKRGKNYKAAVASYDKAALHEVAESLKIVTETSKAKFDETVEVHIKVGVDGRHADQQVRGAIVLPTEQVKLRRFWYSPKGLRHRKLKLPELTT